MIDIERAERNGVLLRQGYEAFARGDLAAVEAMFSPDAVWHAQRLGLLGGDHRGWQAILQFFGRSMELTAGTFRVETQDVLVSPAGAAAVVRSSGRRGERRLDDMQVHLFRIEAERVVEVWQYVGDSDAVNEFWS